MSKTYVFDGLTSSIFLWKGCCVGVAADTDTVDELYRCRQYVRDSSLKLA